MSQIDWSDLVTRALHEDGAYSDVTTLTFVSEESTGKAEIFSRVDGIVCGIHAAEEAFRQAGTGVDQKWLVQDGDQVQAGAPWVQLSGRLRPILTGERTALNFLSHLSGIATLTGKYVNAVAGTNCLVRDTRKTIPGMRAAEKYAVLMGGGTNHRANLSTGGLLKENHLVAGDGLHVVLSKLKTILETKKTGHVFELEVETIDELQLALDAGVTEILLDNFSVPQVHEAVLLTAGRARLESSGGITLENVAEYARTGVDLVAVGALTHSAKPLDLSLLIRSKDTSK